MTERLKNAMYHDRYEKHIYLYAPMPETITTAKEIMNRDKSIISYIVDLENAINELKDYRLALADRYNQLAVMPYKYHVKLWRERRSFSGNKVYYYATVNKLFDDGTKENILYEKFAGTDRNAAIKRYNDLVKQYSGCIAEMDIKKSKWER